MEINAQFRSFVNFAQAAHAEGKDKQIARLDDMGALLPDYGPGLNSRDIVAASGDRVAALWRWQSDKDANNAARNLFKKAVVDIFGGERNIPKNVMDAMLMKDYGAGKPLTARRILAVQAEVTKAFAQFNTAVETAKTSNDDLYDTYAIYEGHPGHNTHAVPKADLDNLVNAAVETAFADKDALEIVTKNLKRIIVRGDKHMQSLDGVKSKAAEIVRTVEELRTASAGNQAFFKAGLELLKNLRGKPVQSGIIANIINCVKAANIGDIKKLSGSSSGEAIHKAVTQFTRLQEDIAISSGGENAFEGADEKMAVRSFIAGLVVAKCGSSATAKIQSALNGENAQKLKFIYREFKNGNFKAENISEGVKDHIGALAGRGEAMLNQLKLSVDVAMGIDASESEPVEEFQGEFDINDFGTWEILDNLEVSARAESKKALETAIPEFIEGNGPAADAIRGIVTGWFGPEPGVEPHKEFRFDANSNIESMINWSICADAKKFAMGNGGNSPFAKDITRNMKVTLPDGKQLSKDFNKALDELAEFVTKGAKKTFADLDAKEKNKVYIVAALLSQETGKAAFDGQIMAFDKDNFFQPIVTGSDQDADEREFKLSFSQDGKLVLDFEATQNLQVVVVGKSTGKTTTAATPPGSTAKTKIQFKISANEFERLANLDFTKFNDEATHTHMAQKTGTNKLKGIPETFAEEFRLDTDEISTNSAIKFDIKDEETTA